LCSASAASISTSGVPARGDDQLRRVVRDDAAISARVEDLAFQRLTVPVFRAAAAHA